MGIKLKNKSEFLIDAFSLPGTQAAGTHKACLVIPFACQLKAIYGKLGTAGTTGTQSNDIKKNGTSIFSGATKLDFATGVTAATYGALSTNPTTFVKGDILTMDVASVHSGVAAIDLCILLVLQKTKASGPVGAMLTDSLGPELDAGV